MDNATKQRLQQPDQFVNLTEQGVGWANRNRRFAAITAALGMALIVLIVGGYTLFQHRSQQAANALGAAMETYQTPVARAGQQLPPGTKTFDSVQQRAKEANAKFADVASRYGMTQSGKLAQYFTGLTYMEAGQNDSAEKTLKTVSESWSGDLSALGKLALSQLYRQTGRNDQAATLLEQLGKGKSNAVPAGEAQLQLAELYTAEGNTAKAKDIYAKLKDSDKDSKGTPGAAGSIAAEKLNPKAPASAGAPQ